VCLLKLMLHKKYTVTVQTEAARLRACFDGKLSYSDCGRENQGLASECDKGDISAVNDSRKDTFGSDKLSTHTKRCSVFFPLIAILFKVFLRLSRSIIIYQDPQC
jgi:hypothetical protein